MKKKIGILGGMGPEATVYLFNMIIELTRAENDQQHITTIVYNNPSTPDRTSAIFGQGPSPLADLMEGASILERAGADFILMPCVTAHYFHNDIVKHISIPFIHLLEETLQYIQSHLPKLKKIGLIATSGTIQSGLFQSLFEREGLQIVVPSVEGQKLFMTAVYGKKGVKSGFKKEPKEKLLALLSELQHQEVDAIIAGCTEIPLVLNQSDMDIPFINPLRLMAETAIRKSGYFLKC
jgi:aspartate racemase